MPKKDVIDEFAFYLDENLNKVYLGKCEHCDSYMFKKCMCQIPKSTSF
jgi:hypothetical protein